MINEQYIVKNKIGEGRSAVFLCEELDRPGDHVAVKVLRPEAETEELQSFKNEYFTLKNLSHPNIIRAYDCGTIVKPEHANDEIKPGSKYFSLEYFNGTNLLDYKGLKNEKLLRKIIRQICSALYYLHQSNYIYYDLKPENILVADVNGSPAVKLIDLGLARYVPDRDDIGPRGTAEYIAPEILKKHNHNSQVDLYSLGIILYRIIYDRFPFEARSEIEIYKAHIEQEFAFPSSPFSEDLIDITQKLLKKEPGARYRTSLEVIARLGFTFDESVCQYWAPAKVFAGRTDVFNMLKAYISDNSSGEVFTVRGFEGAGKTTLVEKVFSTFHSVVFIGNQNNMSGLGFARQILKKIVYDDFVYPNLNEDVLDKVKNILNGNTSSFIDDFKSVISFISNNSDFIIIFDDFNRYNDFTLEVIKAIIPILQVGKLKVILTEDSDSPYAAGSIHNLREISLTPFTEKDVTAFLEKSFFPLFPREELKELILLYADLMPGSIESFIRDVILLDIIKFYASGAKIEVSGSTAGLLKSSHEDIFNLRLNILDDEDIYLAQIISAFEQKVEPKILFELISKTQDDGMRALRNLQHKNILQPLDENTRPVFTSESLKKFVYENINGKEALHKKIGEALIDKYPDFNKSEIARQFELAGNYNECFNLRKEELKEAERLSAYSYQKKILDHLLELPLDENKGKEVLLEKANVLYRLGEYKNALAEINNILKLALDENEKKEILLLKGICLIDSGEYEKGKKQLYDLINDVENKSRRQKLLVEIAHAEYELNKYSEAAKICGEVIIDENALPPEKGKAYNLIGLIEIFLNSNLPGALQNFKKAEDVYSKSAMKLRVAQMEMNIGNIYNMRGEHADAENYWKKSLEINQSIGNLEQEARLLLNFGIFHFDNLAFDKSIEFYKRAITIFQSLGNAQGEGLVYSNLGETYLVICEYEKAEESLGNAIKIFDSLKNMNEKLEALQLLGMYYFTVGNFQKLKQLINDFERSIKNDAGMSKHLSGYKYLKILFDYESKELSSSIEPLKEICKAYFELEEKFQYYNSAVLLVNILVSAEKYDEALSIVNSEEFVSVCDDNKLYLAGKNYLLNIISGYTGLGSLKPSIEYLTEAYNIIENQSITELTWKVLFGLYRYYSDRGNTKKADQYGYYCEATIKLIAANISNEETRKDYLNRREQKEALLKLHELGN